MNSLTLTIAHARFLTRILARPSQHRHITRWITSLAPNYLLHQGVPWIVYDAIDYLDGIDMRGWRIFEYGSGGSTGYWLRRGASVVSVEHDPAWHALVKTSVPRSASLDSRLVPPDLDPDPRAEHDPADPTACVSKHYARNRLLYTRYVAQIDGCPDGSLDLVLVDGRSRPSCMARAVPKLRPGGLLVLDNSDRSYYTARLGDTLAGFQALVFHGVVPCMRTFNQTTIYIKPA